MFTILADTLFTASRTRFHNTLPRIGAESEARMYQHELDQARLGRKSPGYRR